MLHIFHRAFVQCGGGGGGGVDGIGPSYLAQIRSDRAIFKSTGTEKRGSVPMCTDGEKKIHIEEYHGILSVGSLTPLFYRIV